MNIIICDDCLEDRKTLSELLRDYEKSSKEQFRIAEYDLGTRLCEDKDALLEC